MTITTVSRHFDLFPEFRKQFNYLALTHRNKNRLTHEPLDKSISVPPLKVAFHAAALIDFDPCQLSYNRGDNHARGLGIWHGDAGSDAYIAERQPDVSAGCFGIFCRSGSC